MESLALPPFILLTLLQLSLMVVAEEKQEEGAEKGQANGVRVVLNWRRIRRG